MPNGRGMGFGFRGGMGFGFRGSSSPWPFIGRGRGGLPRCSYFLSGAAGTPGGWLYPQTSYYTSSEFSTGQSAYPFYTGALPASGAAPFAPQMSREQELDFLKSEAETIRDRLDQIDTRMRELESEE